MSSQLAVSAISCAIADVVQEGVIAHLADTTVTVLPPARANELQANHLNLFLYRVSSDAAFANADWPPTRTRSGERGRAPLALSLHYLLTPYGVAALPLQPIDDMLLGCAMSALHDHPVLEFAEILGAAYRRHVIPDGVELPWQTEGVRISFDPLSVDDISKLWTTFQGSYRTSVGYQVSVALIDSGQPTRASAPVLMRGLGDRGALVVSNVDPFPFLETISVRLPGLPGSASPGESLITSGMTYSTTGPSAVPGSGIVLRGKNLDAVTEVIMVAARTGIAPPPGFGGGSAVATLIPQAKNATEVVVVLPTDVPAAGRYLVTVRTEVTRTDHPGGVIRTDHPGGVMRTLSNSLPVVIGTRTDFDATTLALNAGTATVRVTTLPPIVAGQDPLLILGNRIFPPDDFIAPATGLQFLVQGLAPGAYQARVRVDGVDSATETVTLR